mgnify:CR=1 FL=1
MYRILWCFVLYGDPIMHNLIPYNQLAGEETFDPDNDLIADYYECLIECDESQSECKRICKEVLI